MKKLILFFSWIILLSSCSSSEDSATNNQNVVLLKKKITTVSSLLGGPPFVVTTNYEYNGNKIFQIVSNQYNKQVYTYDGNLISKIEHFENNSLVIREVYQYNSENKLVSHIGYIFLDGTAEKQVFSYEGNALINVEYLEGDFNNQNTLVKTGKIYLNSGGERIKYESFVQGVYQGKTEYIYSNKNDSFKNVLGLNKDPAISNASTRMVSMMLSYDSNNILINQSTDEGYVYNSQDFPISYSHTLSSGATSSTQFIYE